MKRFMIVAALALSVTACGYDKGGMPNPNIITAPTGLETLPAPFQPQALTSLIGTWTGGTTPTDGHSYPGTLSVVFSQGVQEILQASNGGGGNGNGNGNSENCHGNDDNHGDSHPNDDTCSPQNIVASVTYTSSHTHLTFHGTATGPLSNISVDGTDNSCHYHASGALSNGNHTISGSYSFSGVGCIHDSGNYSISK